MPSPDQNSSETNDGLNLILFAIPQQVLLQLSTAPMLVTLLVGKTLAETAQAIGEASEEVFRGDRLPVLKFPVEIESDLG